LRKVKNSVAAKRGKERKRESLDIIYPYFQRENHEDEILADENHDQAAETSERKGGGDRNKDRKRVLRLSVREG